MFLMYLPILIWMGIIIYAALYGVKKSSQEYAEMPEEKKFKDKVNQLVEILNNSGAKNLESSLLKFYTPEELAAAKEIFKKQNGFTYEEYLEMFNEEKEVTMQDTINDLISGAKNALFNTSGSDEEEDDDPIKFK